MKKCGQSSLLFYGSCTVLFAFPRPSGRAWLQNWYKRTRYPFIHLNPSKHTTIITFSPLGNIIDTPPHAVNSEKKNTIPTVRAFHFDFIIQAQPDSTTSYTMLRLFVWLATIVLVGLSHIALLSGIASAAAPCAPDPNRWVVNHSTHVQTAQPITQSLLLLLLTFSRCHARITHFHNFFFLFFESNRVVCVAKKSLVDCFPTALRWYSRRTTWWFFTRKYVHYVVFAHDSQYKGNMQYESKGFERHCHEDGVWCVTHGDPQSLEVSIWYKGYDYQHQAPSRQGCSPLKYDDCNVYLNYVTRWYGEKKWGWGRGGRSMCARIWGTSYCWMFSFRSLKKIQSVLTLNANKAFLSASNLICVCNASLGLSLFELLRRDRISGWCEKWFWWSSHVVGNVLGLREKNLHFFCLNSTLKYNRNGALVCE